MPQQLWCNLESGTSSTGLFQIFYTNPARRRQQPQQQQQQQQQQQKRQEDDKQQPFFQ